jgi:oxygen-dependent protoporphyrinogen oxidase
LPDIQMDRYDLIIIGAGISGLSLAHYAARADWKTLVIEKSDRTGGCFNTSRQDGFWFELGAHTAYNSYRGLIGIMEDRGISGRILGRARVPYRLLLGGRLRSIPSAMSIPGLLASAPRLLAARKAGRTVESYYSKVVGCANYGRVLSPLLSAVPCQRADEIPADMLFKSRKRRRDVLRSFTLQGGLQGITDAVASEEGVELLTGTNVVATGHEQGVFNVSLADGRRLEAQGLALAVPPPAAAELLRGQYPELSEKLSVIKVAHVESMGVVIAKGDTSVEPVAGIVPAEEDLFWSAVSRDTVPHESLRAFTFHFKPGIAGETKIRRISEVLGTARFKRVEEAGAVLPSPRLGHGRLIREIDHFISFKKLLLTGNYFSGLAIEDCVERSRREFERLSMLIKCI